MTAASARDADLRPQPVAFERGNGAWLYDTEGRRYLYLDSRASRSTPSGTTIPRLVAAIADQASRIIHTSNLFEIPLREALARRLVELSGMTNVFFCNSGLEENEAAIKIARKYGHDRASTCRRSWSTSARSRPSLATLSATGNEKVQKGFEPLVPGFVRVPAERHRGARARGRRAARRRRGVLEAIQGEGRHPAGAQRVSARGARAVRPQGLADDGRRGQCGTGRTAAGSRTSGSGIASPT